MGGRFFKCLYQIYSNPTRSELLRYSSLPFYYILEAYTLYPPFVQECLSSERRGKTPSNCSSWLVLASSKAERATKEARRLRAWIVGRSRILQREDAIADKL